MVADTECLGLYLSPDETRAALTGHPHEGRS
jgi:hypothetical protein